MSELNKLLDEMYQTSPYRRNFRNKTTFETNVGSSVYGEVTKNGTNSIVNKFKDYFNKDTVFYDLGSGIGKMVIHIGLEYNVKKSIGIEYSKERHAGAIYLKEKYAKDSNNIELICGDFLKNNLSDATVIYMDNTVFPNEVSKRIYKLLSKGTLVLYKRKINIKGIFEEEDPNLVERTYNQKKLMWLVK
tara:strand:+ start:8013 stop:8579 length:567 start_codon:yes stop_codon:yes gene_type:complete